MNALKRCFHFALILSLLCCLFATQALAAGIPDNAETMTEDPSRGPEAFGGEDMERIAVFEGKVTRGMLHDLLGGEAVEGLKKGEGRLSVYIDGADYSGIVVTPAIAHTYQTIEKGDATLDAYISCYFMPGSEETFFTVHADAPGSDRAIPATDAASRTEVYRTKDGGVYIVVVNAYLLKVVEDGHGALKAQACGAAENMPWSDSLPDGQALSLAGYSAGDYILITLAAAGNRPAADPRTGEVNAALRYQVTSAEPARTVADLPIQEIEGGDALVEMDGQICRIPATMLAGKNYAVGDKVSVVIAQNGSVLDVAQVVNAPAKTRYKVTFDGNGADGGTTPAALTRRTTSSRYTFGNLPGNTGNLTRSGYAFVGWNTDPQAKEGISSLQLRARSPKATLYAVWARVYTYTLTFDGNGADGGSVPAALTHSTTAGAHTFDALPGNPGNLTRSGYAFAGWNTDSSAEAGLASVDLTETNSSATLYAVWARVYTYTLTFDGNGADGGSVPELLTHTTTNNSHIFSPLPGNTGNLQRHSSSFVGWNQTKWATTTQNSVEMTAEQRNVTLYAIWATTYTVTFDGNGANGGSVPAALTHTTTVGTHTFTLPKGNDGRLVKLGNEFKGWNMNPDATEGIPSVTFEGSNTTTMTVYAVWVKKE